VGQSGRRILIVEDDMFIAMDMEHLVADAGYEVVGPCACVADGLHAARETALDGAILDVNLGDERVWPVADLLDQQGVPFLLATGYSLAEVPKRFQTRTILHKPLQTGALGSALATLGLTVP